MLRQTSLGTLGLSIGGLLALVGLAAYVYGNATLNLAGFFYGIPLFLGGLALKASELKPIPVLPPTSPEIVELRQQQATETQNQLRLDVTRYRYGQKAHLDMSLGRFGLSPTDEERPVLEAVRETATDGAYTLVFVFDSTWFGLEQWQQRQEKIAQFFGPGIRVEVAEPKEETIEVSLISLATDAAS